MAYSLPPLSPPPPLPPPPPPPAGAPGAPGAPPPPGAPGVVATLRSPECPLNVRVAANSPSLWPTMFSETSTGTCCRPLWMAIVRPTMSGTIIERRDQVLIGRRSFVALAFATFCNRWLSTYGPFLIERDMLLLYFCRRSRTIIARVRLFFRVL